MEEQRLFEIKVSTDEGVTWHKRDVNMADLDESGLKPGEIFQYGGDQYKVFAGDDGLRVQKLKKPIIKAKTVIRFIN